MWIFTALVVTAFAAEPTTIEQFLAKPIPEYAQHLTGQALVDYVNEHQPFFKAVYSPEAEELTKFRIMDSKFLVKPKKEEVLTDIVGDEEPPEKLLLLYLLNTFFDARERWPQCTSIRTIRDQSKCGSCWAVSSAGAMSDQLCVQSNGTIKVLISDLDLLACCDPCGFGCQGGFYHKAYQYMQKNGVCTGGRYKEKDSCMPYPFHPCGKHKDQPYYGECPSLHGWPSPKCRKKCNRKYKKCYKDDKYFDQPKRVQLLQLLHTKTLNNKLLILFPTNSAKDSYFIVKDQEKVKREIMKNGPVAASFVIYEDFTHYKSGIYVHTAGRELGSHAIRIIGWGRENGTDYWLIANSYNTDWGEDGYFRILRGANHCEIEERVVGAVMKVD
ncbi:papain family cysteine protease [Ancylostoma caninum]|uniref:Papain family cysteine protease n=1 Tax=Ancylostoma caninum TaxID=29170 RepID=A0A368FNU8_ANCCA|nr:papain family cysteine protease [Ancylostoma caninum]